MVRNRRVGGIPVIKDPNSRGAQLRLEFCDTAPGAKLFPQILGTARNILCPNILKFLIKKEMSSNRSDAMKRAWIARRTSAQKLAAWQKWSHIREFPDKFRIVDGDRRWTNSKILVESQKKEQYRTAPVEVTDRTLTDEERFRVWIYIHRQRKEWDAKEKEMVAFSLVSMVGRASAANILGITVRDVDKLCDIYELSEKLMNLPEPGASITWAREIKKLGWIAAGVLLVIAGALAFGYYRATQPAPLIGVHLLVINHQDFWRMPLLATYRPSCLVRLTRRECHFIWTAG